MIIHSLLYDSSFVIKVLFLSTLLHISLRNQRKENSSEIPAHGIYRSVELFLQPIKLRGISIMMKSWNYYQHELKQYTTDSYFMT